MMCLALLVVGVVVASTASALNVTTSVNPDTVDSLDVPAYLGLWYQMAADQIVLDSFEKDAYCDTALYGDNGDGTLSVHNYAKVGAPDGEDYVIDGYAYQTKPDEEPGQLKVVFNSDDAAPFPAPYWILELGPINKDGLYDYAIVSDNLSLFLFVLARDPVTYNEKYKTSVTATLTELGFQGYTVPIDTYQESDCVYEANSRQKQVGLGVAPNPDTVDELIVAKYLGNWYQMAANAAVMNTFEKDNVCTTATYGDNGDGTISVHNYANLVTAGGQPTVIDGYAFQSNPEEEPGQLKVVFPNDDNASPFPAPYWVLELGPENEDGLYDYSIISDNLSLYLFVLARDPAVYNEKYKSSVDAKLVELGFTGRSAPIDTYQGADCVYESNSRKQMMLQDKKHPEVSMEKFASVVDKLLTKKQ